VTMMTNVFCGLKTNVAVMTEGTSAFICVSLISLVV
jgi:hypothetical protein